MDTPREGVNSNWIAFFVMVFGLLVLMIGVRPELQPRVGHEGAPGPAIEIAGHVITWSSASVLTVALARSVRASRKRPTA